MRYQGVVTQQDWKEGILRSPSECAFARAIRRQFPEPAAVFVSNWELNQGKSDRWTVLVYSKLPSSVTRAPNGLLKMVPKAERTPAMAQEEKDIRMLKGTLSEAATTLGKAFDNGLTERPDYQFEYFLDEWPKT